MNFEYVAGHVALDYVATVAERTTTRLERLITPEDLGDWLVDAGVLDAAPQVRAVDLATARELREALYPFIVALAGGPPLHSGPRHTLNRFAAAVGPALRLDEQATVRRTGTVGAALAHIAQCGLLLAREEERDSIRWCAGANCTRPFLDRSHARRRRWCGMSTCGNKAKAAAYRTRLSQTS